MDDQTESSNDKKIDQLNQPPLVPPQPPLLSVSIPTTPQTDPYHQQPPPPFPPVGGPGPSMPTFSPSSYTAGSPTGKHPLYRGIRPRGGKWVSEIREPKKTTRIWLGTYPTAEMAAAAYDAAALALKGTDAILNFPEEALQYPIPESLSAAEIRKVAAAAAETKGNKDNKVKKTDELELEKQVGKEGAEEEFMDIEALFDMPNLLVDMAGGMMVSPPRMTSTDDRDLPEDEGAGSLWNYD